MKNIFKQEKMNMSFYFLFFFFFVFFYKYAIIHCCTDDQLNIFKNIYVQYNAQYFITFAALCNIYALNYASQHFVFSIYY